MYFLISSMKFQLPRTLHHLLDLLPLHCHGASLIQPVHYAVGIRQVFGWQQTSGEANTDEAVFATRLPELVYFGMKSLVEIILECSCGRSTGVEEFLTLTSQ